MSVARKTQSRFKVGDRVIFLYGPRQLLGEVIEDRGPLGTYGRRIFVVRAKLGDDDETTFEVTEDNLDDFSPEIEEKSLPGTRVEYSVDYVRQGSSRRWQATVKRGRVYQGVTAKGAVAYATAGREGETLNDERHGTVAVLLEPPANDPDASMAAAARRLADRKFMRRHPDAQIEESF